jgi:hypothetical protein
MFLISQVGRFSELFSDALNAPEYRLKHFRTPSNLTITPLNHQNGWIQFSWFNRPSVQKIKVNKKVQQNLHPCLTKGKVIKRRTNCESIDGFLENRTCEAQNLRITRLQERYLTHLPHRSRLHTSFGHISAFNLRDLSVVNVVGNTFETFFTNWLNVWQIRTCLSDLGKVC